MQVVRKLTQADRLLADGRKVADVCREVQVSEQAYYPVAKPVRLVEGRRRQRLKELEMENSTLKRGMATGRGGSRKDATFDKKANRHTCCRSKVAWRHKNACPLLKFDDEGDV